MNVFTRLTTRYLMANKTRTIVTIIGIILSAAMITGVTASVSSFRDYLIELAKADAGDWHGAVFDLPSGRLDDLASNEAVESYEYIQNMGYSLIDDPANDYKPYIFIGGMSDGLTSRLPVNIIEGRLPENQNEILLPRHLATNGGFNCSLNDRLELDLGYRLQDGTKLWQTTGYFHEDDGNPEEFTGTDKQEFIVVGFYERPTFESFSAAGYTALTLADSEDITSDVYIKLKNPKGIYDFMKTEFPDLLYTTNRDLLMYSGISNDSNFTDVMNGLSAILIGLIVFGSISLIYNAFRISINERTKQFGLLSSVGATKRQLSNTVLTEALILSLIGIPIGILAGICGMALTFAFTRNLFNLFIAGSSISMKLSLYPLSIAASAAIGLLTVLVSAYIHVKRALRVSTMDAIRQTKDIRIKPRKVRTSKLVYKLFGFEAMLARKSFKRSSGQYRATVISLFLSVVLFISASSFYTYLTVSSEDVLGEAEYDITLRYDREMASHISLSDLYEKLAPLQGIESSLYLMNVYGTSDIPRTILNQRYTDYMYTGQEGDFYMGVLLIFVSDEAYSRVLDENGLDENIFMNTEAPSGLALDFNRLYDYEDGKYHTFNILDEDTFDITLRTNRQIEGYIIDDSYTEEDGSSVYIYVNSEGDTIEVPESEFWVETPLRAGGTLKDLPYFMDAFSGGLGLMYPYSSMEAVLGANISNPDAAILFKAEDHRKLSETIYEVLDDNDLPTASLYNIAASQESSRALVKVIRIFSYGFIILISLIATANVFNTISTNIRLRTREFAVLRSVGLDGRGLNRIMNFECIFYGIRSLIYGLPVAIGLSYLIYRAISNGWETSYMFPTTAVIIASGSVFAVVFLTMMYAMRKIKQTNTVEALRNENL